MDKIIINSAGLAYYGMLRDLYMISFPVFEQRTDEQQDDAFSCLNYHLNAYAEDGCFIGFISYWEFSDYIYIEHFAINQSLRGKGHGYRILQRFISEASKMVLLEIDPITDEVSEARLRFYKRCGFHKNPYPHIHPPYRSGCKGHSLLVLTTEREITESEYRLFNKELTDVVMRKN